MTRRPGPGTVGGLVGMLCAVVALGPALRPGYLLFYDMVFVPHLPINAHTLGVDGSVPRAVPNDLVVAVLSQVAPGWVVQKVLLVAVFVLVGAGVGRLVRSRPAAAAAAVFACWNPYLGERLAIGHWGFLLGYAVLPFLVAAAGAYRRGTDRGRVRLGVWTVLMALTGSTGAVLGLLTVLCVMLVPGQSVRPRIGRIGWAIGLFLLANAPWWFTYLTLAPHSGADPAGVEAFMSRADTPLGLFPSLLTTGGIWNEGVWFAGRDSVVVSAAALIVTLVALVVAARTRGWRRDPALTGLGVAGLICLFVAAASALPGGRDLVRLIVTDVPGGGLLRDSQKFVAVWALVVAVAAGIMVQRLCEAASTARIGRPATALVAGIVALWPVATLTGMVWGAGGKWDAVAYPTAYTRMADRIDRLPAGAVAIFPWTLYRSYAWDGHRVVLDPWQRLVDRPVLVNDDLPLSDRVVRGESAAARRVTTALHSGGDALSALRQDGVRYVLVETDQPRTAGVPRLDASSRIARAPGLALYDIGRHGVVAGVSQPHAWWRYLGLAAGGVAVLVVAGDTAFGLRRKSRPARSPTGA